MPTPEPPTGEPQGLLLIADGIGGFDLCAGSMTKLIPQGGLPLEVRVVHWGHGVGRWLADLTRSENVLRHAGLAAQQVLAFRRQRPEAPVFLLGKSGGSGVVLRILEQLPEASVERVILIAPAVSPRYDLDRALRSIRREMVVFTSPLDFALLGAGTWLFGTIDRVRGVGAGLIGFRRPSPNHDPDRQARFDRQVRQFRWRPAMIRVGYLGGHLAVDLPPFLRRYVVPMLEAGPVDLDVIVSGRPSSRASSDDSPTLTEGRTASSPAPPSS